jgi:dTDP-3-amino-3,6-dideoxy-alpha-D-glucopyranose N,N-dimethyltransferase
VSTQLPPLDNPDGMYGVELAEVYELVHGGRGKDYDGEAALVARHVRELLPAAESLLDVACGTGAHLDAFARIFAGVEGIELSEPMLEAALALRPGLRLHRGDMRTFHIGRTYDVVTCMFGSIGYLTTVDELHAALRRFTAHLNPGGVVAIDPWWFPDTYLDGYVAGAVIDSIADSTVDGAVRTGTVARVSHSRREGDASRMEVHYLVARPDIGVRHFVETHLISLFTREQYESAFRAAGLAVRYVPGVQSGRGLFIGSL